MTTPDADDASPSPEYSGDPDESDMAVDQKTELQSCEGSPDQKTNGQKHAANAKDPTRPRRKKARRACYACQRAHLTCGDERPCHRCVKRGLQDSCMDGVRKKAKYLHDAPDGALMPGVGGHYPHVNGTRPAPLPSQEPVPVPVGQQGSYYTQAPSTTYYAHAVPAQAPSSQEAAFNGQQAPISPPYSQNPAAVPSIPSTLAQGRPTQMHQFGGPLFDPSDPALFNFDISSLNFGNHYGALELGMLGHMSAGAADAATNDHQINPLNQAAHLFNPQMPPGTYGDNHGIPAHMSFGPDGLPAGEWQNPHSRHGSIQIQTPNNTPITTTIDHVGNRHDSLNGPHAYAIGQGPSSLSSASPASTDVNSGYENENPLPGTTLFANSQQSHVQRSPTVARLPQENRLPGGPLQPLQSNAIRKRRRDLKHIYEGITKAYDYTGSYHRLRLILEKRFNKTNQHKAIRALATFRPVLLSMAIDLSHDDLVHTEKNLQRSLITLQENYVEVGTPSLICRRSGEVVGMNKEFEILTGWKREVLLGHVPNLNVNTGPPVEQSNNSGMSTRTSTTPLMLGEEPDTSPHALNVIELMDEMAALQYLEDFADLAYNDPLGHGHRRVNLLRYLTKEDMDAAAITNGKPAVSIKQENGSIHQGEAAMKNLGANGLIDCMIMWHIKRDNFEFPMLVSIHIMPMLKP